MRSDRKATRIDAGTLFRDFDWCGKTCGTSFLGILTCAGKCGTLFFGILIGAEKVWDFYFVSWILTGAISKVIIKGTTVVYASSLFR